MAHLDLWLWVPGTKCWVLCWYCVVSHVRMPQMESKSFQIIGWCIQNEEENISRNSKYILNPDYLCITFRTTWCKIMKFSKNGQKYELFGCCLKNQFVMGFKFFGGSKTGQTGQYPPGGNTVWMSPFCVDSILTRRNLGRLVGINWATFGIGFGGGSLTGTKKFGRVIEKKFWKYFEEIFHNF